MKSDTLDIREQIGITLHQLGRIAPQVVERAQQGPAGGQLEEAGIEVAATSPARAPRPSSTPRAA